MATTDGLANFLARRDDEIGSIILYNDVWRTVRKLFDLHERASGVLVYPSSWRGCLCAYPKRSRDDVFQRSSTNLLSHALSLARLCEGRAAARGGCSGSLRDIAHLPRDARNKYIVRNRADAPWEWRLRRETATREAGTRGIFERSPRDLKRRSITWIVNPAGRSLNSFTVVRGAP